MPRYFTAGIAAMGMILTAYHPNVPSPLPVVKRMPANRSATATAMDRQPVMIFILFQEALSDLHGHWQYLHGYTPFFTI